MSGKVRIIGGTWRGRKLDVTDIAGLRPTPDRVRETLFNWLQPYISGARCLDLYAGTGALGFESLSRGASGVLMVENNEKLVKTLKQAAINLGATGASIVSMDVTAWLENCRDVFDIVFLDPPYSDKQAGKNISQLLNCACLKPGSMIYVESDYELEGIDKRLELVKSGRAGVVQYRLFRHA